MDYSLSTLIANVRRRASLPNVAGTGSQDSDIIAQLNDVLQLKLAARLISVREGYLRQVSDVTLGTGTRYRIPNRALGNKLAAAMLIDSNGSTLQKLDEIPYSRLREFYSATGTAGYTFEAGSIVFVPSTPTSSAATLRMVYYIRPNQLTATSTDYYTITAIAGNVLTIGAHTIFANSTKIDLIKATSPFEHVGIGTTASAIGGTSISVSTAIAERLEVGDYVCLQDKSPVAQIPGEFYPVLAHMTAMEMLAAIGDRENYDKLDKQLPKLEAEATALISPRNEEGAKKIMSAAGSLGAIDGTYKRTFWGI